ncbi:serine/threonine protein kinase with TPR repeats [Candidatus Koribacter versatilis Ellin345]|uniref:non-specific serine/threonine protein kinase n=1 Tax=Koribacter versatilis (strain Ellin345) TaxID=204669 RepID=Q1ILY3_KORVE|nr:serine/threonine-protein kinase [Candidatus Koribacter versatilis]ABF42117.1 serine/threonine protein kinase with TPR repeats [Candidatus Koribacter versatilis Ellin345]
MTSPAPATGENIGHYRVLGKLGAGGMGVVYKALDTKLQRTVCLKFLPSDTALSDRDRRNLLQEARAASTLDHPNIGAIYGIEETPDQHPFIVMAYYEGQTLAQAMDSGAAGAHPLDIVCQVARGLAAAHARNIVHRDVKPSNIILTTDNVAKIVDFGLARVVSSSAMTQSMHTSGTLPYMAPEQVLGEAITPACDVWALGIILVQLLTGSYPFIRENTTAIAFAIVNLPPAGMELLPQALAPVAYRALAKQPEHRYPTAKEFLAALVAANDELAASARGADTDSPTRSNAISAKELKQLAEHASTARWNTQQRQTSKRVLYAAIVLLVAVVVALLLPSVRTRLNTVIPSNTVEHIAVLPFDNASGDPSNEAIAAGLMDSLTGELSNLSAGKQTLWVVPASVVRAHKISDPTAAAKVLGASLVVKGSIQHNGDDVRLRVDLIDARNLRQIGSATLEDRTGDIGALQDEAVVRLAGLMNIKLSTEMLRATGGRGSPASYELYLRALGYMQRYDKAGNLDQAIEDLNQSIHLDPQFALGFASLGECYRLKNVVDPKQKWVDQALANLQHAMQLNDRVAAPHVSLAWLQSALGQHDLALQEYQKALAINPRDPEAVKGLSREYERAGRTADAEAGFKQAILLRPDYWDSYNALGSFYVRQQRYPEAIAQFRRVLDLTPDNSAAYSNVAGVLLLIGDPASQKEAETALRRSLDLSPSYAAYANLGRLYMSQKRYAEGVDITRKALSMNDQNYEVWANLTVMLQWMHDDVGAADSRAHTFALLKPYVVAHPEDANAHSSLATHYAKAGDRTNAMREIDAALGLQPHDSTVLADAAEVYEDFGDRKRAIDFAQKSLKNGNSLDDLQVRPELQQLLKDPGFRSNPK